MKDISSKEEEHSMSEFAKIKVIGVGGGGGNAVSRMIGSDLENVDFLLLHLVRTFQENLVVLMF